MSKNDTALIINSIQNWLAVSEVWFATVYLLLSFPLLSNPDTWVLELEDQQLPGNHAGKP